MTPSEVGNINDKNVVGLFWLTVLSDDGKPLRLGLVTSALFSVQIGLEFLASRSSANGGLTVSRVYDWVKI